MGYLDEHVRDVSDEFLRLFRARTQEYFKLAQTNASNKRLGMNVSDKKCYGRVRWDISQKFYAIDSKKYLGIFRKFT